MTNQPLSNIIKRDPYSGKIERPTLLLQNNGFETIHKIGSYQNWHFSVKANGIDEISFTVNKYTNNKQCPFWDELSDLKIVEVKGYGRFQIKVSYEDAAQTVKTVTGQSLEVELGQLPLYLHVNDEEAMDMVKTEYSSDNYTDEGKFIPTVFYNEECEKHSLLHRVLADKAPHWTIGHVPEYVTKDDDPNTNAELVSSFQRTYTVDGASIYDFLTGDVAQETNVVFIFDTFHRKINVYSLYDCYVDGELKENAYGEDTTILISKKKLTNQISIESNVDQLKNCFRVTGGDDIITAYVAAVNMSGDNYIHMFSPYQLKEMPKQLSDAITKYQEEKAEHEVEYIGQDGIFTRLINAYSDLRYYESSMGPNIDPVKTSAEEQYHNVTEELLALRNGVGVYSLNDYNAQYHQGINKNIESLAEVYLDSRYDVEVVDETTSYNETTHEWTGVLKITRTSDKKDVHPVGTTPDDLDKYAIALTITENDDINGQLAYTEQKLYKALAKSSMSEIDFDIANMSDTEIRNYFEQFSLNRLKGFAEGYNSCISILSKLKESDTSDSAQALYDKYAKRYFILTGLKNEEINIEGIIPHRQQQVDGCNDMIKELEGRQKEFQKEWDFKNYLHNIDPTDELFKIFASYRREDNYSNSNFTSDALVDDNGYIDTAQCIEKAQDLLEAATKELQKACMLQRTLSCSFNNLLILPEFKNLYDSFSMFNYFRVRTEDELFKMRLICVDFDESNPSDLSITFSDQVISLGSTEAMGNDIQSILNQASSIAASYPTVAKQAEQGNKAQSTFNELKAQGLNSMLMKIKNSDDEEVTISQAGILCKKMNDEGNYGLKQCRITGNVMAFTDDGWQSMRTGIGEMDIKDPLSDMDEIHTVYGFIGDAVVGNLLAGQTAWIGDKNGSVIISSEGIKLNGGKITWEKPIPQGAVDGLVAKLDGIDDFQDAVKNSLGVTTITSDSVISPKIGGGYLYITKNGYPAVEINPLGSGFDGKSGDVFRISDKNNNPVMGVDGNGNGYYSGKVTATSGEIGGWELTSDGALKSEMVIDGGEDIGVVSHNLLLQPFQSTSKYNTWAISSQFYKNAKYSPHWYITIGGYFKTNNSIDARGLTVSGNITASDIDSGNITAKAITSTTIVNCNKLLAVGDVQVPNLLAVNGNADATIKADKFEITDRFEIKPSQSNTAIIGFYNNIGGSFWFNQNIETALVDPNANNASLISSSWYRARFNTTQFDANVSGQVHLKFADNITEYPAIGSAPTTGNRVAYIQSNTNPGLFVKGEFGTDDFSIKGIQIPSSDIRLKKNIKPSEVDGLGTINKIEMVQFDWKDRETHWNVGMIADEIEKLDPNLSFGGGYDDDGCMNVKSVNSFYLLGYCVKAIQELSQENQRLHKEMDILKQKMEVMQNEQN